MCYTLSKGSMPNDKGKPAVMPGRKATVPLIKREAALPKGRWFGISVQRKSPSKNLLGLYFF